MSRNGPDGHRSHALRTVEQRTRAQLRRLRDAARRLVDVRGRREARLELAALRREHPGLADNLSPLERRDAQTILLVSLSADLQQARLEAILAKALQLQGAHVTILTWRSARQARTLFRALRLRDVVFYDDVAGVTTAYRDEAERVLEGSPTVKDLLHFDHRGVRVGRQALSTVVRTRHEPRVDVDDPAVRESIVQTLMYALEGIDGAERVLDAVRPDQLLLVERGYASFGPIFDLALQRGIPVVQFQSAHRDDAFQLKRYTLETRELHPRSLDARTWERLLERGLTDDRELRLEAELDARAAGKWFMARRLGHTSTSRGPDELRRRLRLDPDRKVAVLFSHVLWDASMFYGTDLYPDQGRWFAETVRVAAEDDSVQWVIKLHPALYWKLRSDGVVDEPSELAMIRETVGELPAHMRLVHPNDDIDNVDLFQIVDAGVTIRGTVGLELPRLGVPVLTAGTSDYTGRGFTVDSQSIEEYEDNVRAVGALPRLSDEQIRTAKLYAYGIFCVRPWRFRSFALDFLPLDEAGDTLEHRLRYVIRTRAELDDAGDLAEFARWVLDSDDPDFTNRALLES